MSRLRLFVSQIRIAIIFYILCIILTGCSKKESYEERVILNFMDVGIPNEIKVASKIIEEFEAKNPHIKIKPTFVDIGNLETKYLSNVAGGAAPDILYLYDTALPTLVESGTVLNLDSLIQNDKEFSLEKFHPDSQKFCTIDEKIYGLAPTFGTMIIFYNKTIFDKTGVPYPENGWTQEDFKTICIALTKDFDKDGKIDQFAIDEIGFFLWAPFIIQNGGHIISEDRNRCLLDSDVAIETLSFVHDLYAKYKVVATQLTAPGLRDMGRYVPFATGRVAMLPGDFSMKDNFKKVDWDIVCYPQGKKPAFHGGAWLYSISANTRHQKECWEFMKWLVNEKNQRISMKEGAMFVLPSNLIVLEEFLNSYPDKNMDAFRISLKNLITEYQLKHANQFFSIIGEELNPYLQGIKAGEISVIAKKATQKINKALSK